MYSYLGVDMMTLASGVSLNDQGYLRLLRVECSDIRVVS